MTADRAAAGRPRAEKDLGHEVRVGDRYAEPKGTHRSWVEEDALERLDEPVDPHVVASEETFEIVGAISASTPLKGRQVDVVVDAEVLERREVPVVYRLPQAELHGGTVTEPAGYVLAVHALRSRRQPQQLLRLQVFEQRAVGGGGGVMDLVDHHDVVRIRVNR